MAQKTILAVEDDSAFSAYIKAVLTDLGYTVIGPTATGEDAIAQAMVRKPDLVLMDIDLAGVMNGIEAADRIRSFLDIPIIYLTGHSEAPFLKQASVTASYGYLIKPVTRQELSVTIEMAFHRHALDAKLKDSDARLRLALASARMGVWEWNVVTGQVFWSPECYEIFGSIDFGGTFESFMSFLHPEETPRMMAASVQLTVDHPVFQREFRIIRPDGEVRWLNDLGQGQFDGSGVLIRMTGTVQDITERKQAEDALRESETKLRAILDGSRDAIGVSKEGIHTFANAAYVSLFGYESDDELIGTPILNLIAAESRGLIEERVKNRAKGESVPSFYEATGLRRDGTTFLVEALVSTYVLKEQQFSQVIMRDITEKRRLEEQLRQGQKMEAVGALAGGVAHDFNNILSVIMGFANLIQMGMDKGDLLRQYVDQIVASSERAADLIQSLLAFSRKQRITLEPRAVNGVVTTTAKLLARLLPEDMGLALNLVEEDTLSLLDVTQIGQVLMNLATNARDAMPHGGSLIITTQLAKIDQDFTKAHGFGRVGEYVKLSVSDTGTGMDEKTMKRIFEPFFTTKDVGKGTGLGLASAYGIVKQHNGYIEASSTPFMGTTFDIYLPLLDPLQWQEAPVAGEIKGGVETILVVEDDRDVRSMLTRILGSHGYTTIEAVDGDDAIRLHHSHREQIDLVILDVVMPGKNGKEALDEISRTDPGVKAIFVSGYTGDIVIDKGIRSEMVDFLQKPISVVTLLAKVREVLGR